MNDNFSNPNVPSPSNETLASEAVNLIQKSLSSDRTGSSALLTFLGKGAFTYAFRVVGNSQAVIKVTQKDSFSKFSNFQRKAATELAKTIQNYPNISFKVPNLTVIKTAKIDGQDYMIYQEDFACGTALGQLTDGELTEDEVLNVFRGLAQLLGKCAQADFSYCDFKPLEHIYIEKTPTKLITVTLIDWGNAKSLKDSLEGAFQDVFQFYQELPSAFGKIAQTTKRHPVELAQSRTYPTVVLRYSLLPFPYLPSWLREQNVYLSNIGGRARDKQGYIKNLWQLIIEGIPTVTQSGNWDELYSNWEQNKDFVSYLVLSLKILSAFEKEAADSWVKDIQSSRILDENSLFKLVEEIEQNVKDATKSNANPEIQFVYRHAKLADFFSRLKADLKVYIALQRSNLSPNKQDRLNQLEQLKTTFEKHFYFAQEYKKLAAEVQLETDRKNAKDTFLQAVKARNLDEATNAFGKLDTEEQKNNQKWLGNLSQYSQTYTQINAAINAYQPEKLKDILANFSQLAQLEFPLIAKDEKFEAIARAFSQKDKVFDDWLTHVNYSYNIRRKIESLKEGERQGFQTATRYKELSNEVQASYDESLQTCETLPNRDNLTDLKQYESLSFFNREKYNELEKKVTAFEEQKQNFEQALAKCQNWETYLELIQGNKGWWQEYKKQILERANTIIQTILQDAAQWQDLTQIHNDIQKMPNSQTLELDFGNLQSEISTDLDKIEKFRSLQLLVDKQAVPNDATMKQFPAEFGTEFSQADQDTYKTNYQALNNLIESQTQSMVLANQINAQLSEFKAGQDGLHKKLKEQSNWQVIQLPILMMVLLLVIGGLIWNILKERGTFSPSTATPVPSETLSPTLTHMPTITSVPTQIPSETLIPTPQYVQIPLTINADDNLFMSSDCNGEPILRFTGVGSIKVETKNISGDTPPGKCIAVRFEIQVLNTAYNFNSTCVLTASDFTIQSNDSNSPSVAGKILKPELITNSPCMPNEAKPDSYLVEIAGYYLRTDEQQP
jgi:hypothetical protein